MAVETRVFTLLWDATLNQYVGYQDQAGAITYFNLPADPSTTGDIGATLEAQQAALAALSSAVSVLQVGYTGVPAVGSPKVVNDSATSYTLIAGDFLLKSVRTNSALANTVQANTPLSYGLSDGSRLHITQMGVGPTRIVPGTGAVILPAGIDQVAQQFGDVELEAISPTEWRLSGAVAPSITQITVSVPASMTGTGIVGATMTGVDPTHAGGGTITTRQFLNNGQVHASGSTYVLVGGDTADAIQFQAIITKAGVPAFVSTSAPIIVVASGETRPQNLVKPTIEVLTGNRLGDTIRLRVGTWNNTPVGTPGYTVALKRGGVTIQTYTLSAATLFQDYTIDALDLSTQLTITVTATNGAGTITPGADSLPFQVAGPAPVYSGGATLTPATPVVGQTITANPGSVSGQGLTYAYSFRYVPGSPLPLQTPPNQYISHAAVAGNPPLPSDQGRQMVCDITVSNSGGSITITTPSVTFSAVAPPPAQGTATSNGIPHGGTQIFPVSGGPQTVTVGSRPWGIHGTKYTGNYGGSTERLVLPLNIAPPSFRVFGCYNLYWNNVDPSANGGRNWTEWDEANADWQRVGVASVTYNLHGVPGGYQGAPETVHGQWSMVPVNNLTAMRQWLTDLCNRYSIIDYIEVCNEFWTGAYPGVYWGGTEAQLRTLCNQVLDWRAAYQAATGRYIKIQAPSTPGTVGHANEQLRFFDAYEASNPGRCAQFDSFSIHLYGATESDVHLYTGGAGSGFSTLRAGLNARSWGLNKEIRDGEHGFYDPNVSAHQAHNLVLRLLANGGSGTDFFFYGETGSSSDTHLGQPDINANIRQGMERLNQFKNTTITRITPGTLGTFWAVDYITGATAPAPAPGPSPSPSPPAPAPSPSAPSLVSSQFNPYPDGALSPTGVSATAVADIPAGVQNGELLQMVVANIDTTKTQTTPAGWTLISTATTSGGATGVRTQVYNRVASSEPASYNITLSSSGAWLTNVCRISAGASSDATPVTANGTPSGSPSGLSNAGITTTGSNRLLVAVAAQYAPGGTTWNSAPAVEVPSGWTLDAAIWHQHGPNMAVIHRVQPAAGASGALLFGCDGDGTNFTTVQCMAYKPA